jgi:hypothetical protein
MKVPFYLLIWKVKLKFVPEIVKGFNFRYLKGQSN